MDVSLYMVFLRQGEPEYQEEIKIDGKYLAFKFKSLEFKYEIERFSK